MTRSPGRPDPAPPGGPGHVSPGAAGGEGSTASLVASFARRKARFLAVVSHELRTPLTAIASFTDSLATDELAPAERPLALDAVRRNTGRMLALVDDLMLLSRLETGDLPLAIAAVDVPTLVGEAAAALSRAEPAITVAVSTVAVSPGGGAAARGDAALLGQVVYLALGVVAGPAADRRVELATDASSDGWTITALARQAEGLTEEHLLASTLANTQPPHRRRSTALWLLLAEAMVERHGGRLDLGFDPAIGTSATVYLPARSAPVQGI